MAVDSEQRKKLSLVLKGIEHITGNFVEQCEVRQKIKKKYLVILCFSVYNQTGEGFFLIWLNKLDSTE